MSSFQHMVRDIFEILNAIRTSPAQYARDLERQMHQYKSNNAKHRKSAVPVMTREGASAVKEAIDTLNEIQTLAPLQFCQGLSRATQLHVNDTGLLGIVGHIGSKENTLQDRLQEFGTWGDCIAQALDYGSVDGFQVLASLITDDGLSTRPHRNAILNPRFKKVGIGAGPHSEYKSVACIVFAGEFNEKESLPSIEIPDTGVNPVPEAEDWMEGAVKMTCEIRTEVEDGVTVKKIKKYWEMSDGSTKVTEHVVRPKD